MPRKTTIRQHVEKILCDHPEARNSDKLLMIKYWETVDQVSFDSSFISDFISKATSPESIRRARQLIQEEGIYNPTDAVQAIRRSRELDMVEAIHVRNVI